jgi:hypothetical protein
VGSTTRGGTGADRARASAAAAAQVAADLLARAWPVMQLGFSRAGSHDAGCERLTRALRRGIKASGKACSPLLQHLLETLPVLFQQTRRACFMFVVSELTKVGRRAGAASARQRPCSRCHNEQKQHPDCLLLAPAHPHAHTHAAAPPAGLWRRAAV